MLGAASATPPVLARRREGGHPILSHLSKALHHLAEQIFEVVDGDRRRRFAQQRHAPLPALPALLRAPRERRQPRGTPPGPVVEDVTVYGQRRAERRAALEEILPLRPQRP